MGLFDFVTNDVLGLGQGDKNAEDTYRIAEQLFKELDVPQANAILAKLKDVKYAGDVNQVKQADSSLGGYSEDPRLREAQLRALTQLETLGSEGGLNATDKARLADIQREQLGQARGAREAIMQRAQERGVGGSGLDLAQQMMAQQSASEQANKRGMDVAAMAQQRALDAIMGAGNMGGNMRNQEFAQAQGKANAQDAINQFNARNAMSVQQRNLDTRQDLNKVNTLGRNSNLMGLTQAEYDNELRKRAGQAGQLGAVANAQSGAGAKKDAFFGAALGAAGSAMGKPG